MKRKRLLVPLSHDFMLRADNVTESATGEWIADVYLDNGVTVVHERVVINDAPAREEWVQSVSGPDRPTDEELRIGILRLYELITAGGTGPEPPLSTVCDNTADAQTSGGDESVVDRIVREAETFLSLDGRPFMTVVINNVSTTISVDSSEARGWVLERQHTIAGTLNRNIVRDCLEMLRFRAWRSRDRREVFVRLGHVEDRLYLDLGSGSETIEITRDDWRPITDPPIPFYRPAGMLSLPRPVRGGSIDQLREFVNVASDADWALVLTWLIAAFHPTGPYPVLALTGHEGSTKTSIARRLISLVDPQTTSLQPANANDREVAIRARHSWVIGYDNLSEISDRFSDTLCRVSTGGSLGVKQLFTDSDQQHFLFCRPVVLTSIEDIVTRPDLLERSIIVPLPMILPAKRRSEQELRVAFERQRAAILGALLDAVVVSLREVATVHLPEPPRMADAVRWATAAESTLGLHPGAVVDAFTNRQSEGLRDLAEDSPVLTTLVKLLETTGEFEGSATALLAELENYLGSRKPLGWPGNARALSGHLQRRERQLKIIGVGMSTHRTAGSRVIRIERLQDSAGR